MDRQKRADRRSQALPTYFVFESTCGYALLLAPHGLTQVGDKHYTDTEKLINLCDQFFEVVAVQSFGSTHHHALVQYKAISKGIVTEQLMDFLECHLPKPANKDGKPCYVLALADAEMQYPISLTTKVSTICTLFHNNDIMRVFRTNIAKIIKDMKPGDLGKDQRKMALTYIRDRMSLIIQPP